MTMYLIKCSSFLLHHELLQQKYELLLYCDVVLQKMMHSNNNNNIYNILEVNNIIYQQTCYVFTRENEVYSLLVFTTANFTTKDSLEVHLQPQNRLGTTASTYGTLIM